MVSMADVTIEAARLTKRYGSRTAVRELSFTARQGDVVGLLGPNGSGKTTTIRLLTTVLPPTVGTFAVAGVPSSRPTEIRRRVGVLPESSGYPGHQTGREYLRYHARLFGRTRPDAIRIADDLLAEVGLAERGSSRISTYSRGMRQRLGIARALVNDPVVVFLDEPTLGLDPAGQRQVLGMVRQIARDRGATVVLSTHTLPEVEEVCTSAIILSDGRVLVSGPMSEVTRTVTVQHSGQLRVPVDLVDQARAALSAVPGLSLEPVDGRPDILKISLTEGRDRSDSGLNPALRAVLAADVPVLSYEVEGARLSTAFLTMTADGGR
jgi:ABC-2 type transport system ATP-binding protein